MAHIYFYVYFVKEKSIVSNGVSLPLIFKFEACIQFPFFRLACSCILDWQKVIFGRVAIEGFVRACPT